MYNAQETKALTIGGIAPLNMVSCVSVRSSGTLKVFSKFNQILIFDFQILKTIYSYLMILFTFID